MMAVSAISGAPPSADLPDMARKQTLTWVAKLKQWRKRRKVNGKPKDFYLGTGDGPSDRPSYAKALAKWQDIELALRISERLPREFIEALVFAGVNPDRPLPFSITQHMDEPSSAAGEPLRKWANATLPVREDEAATKAASRKLSEWVDGYIAAQKERYEHGLAFPNAPRDERISGVRFMSYRFNAQLIRACWAKDLVPPDEAGMAYLMKKFKDEQKALLTSGKIQPGTLNERMKTLRHVVIWLHRNYVIPTIPREATKICAAYHVERSAKALDLDTLHRLWANASPRLRTYIALGLNCGFYAQDIATLRRSHLNDTHIVRNRHKTNIPTRFKLWEVTRQLLADNANPGARSPDDLVLIAAKGGPLLVIDPAANGGKGKRWCQIENDLLALRKRLDIPGVTFSMFRDTSSTKVESLDRRMTDLFDGHKDRRMAGHYIDGDMVDYSALFADLDAVIDKLEAYFSLRL